MTPDLFSVLPARRALPFRTVAGEVMVRDPASSQVHILNPAAGVVWQCCDGNTTVGDCEARLRAAFAIPGEVDVAADIGETVSDFARKGLVDAPRGGA